MRRRTRRALGVLSLGLASALLGGCGAGAAPSQEAQPPESPPYPQQQYQQPGSAEPTYGQPGYGPPPTGTSESPMDFSQPPEPSTLAEWEAYFERNANTLASGFQCLDACRALQSLERAQKRICEILSGGDDPERRCERAKERVAAAKSRVESQCQCPATP
ncbi:MAG: hypothetical protein R3B07_27520 [Polyangiaceae bacterium]